VPFRAVQLVDSAANTIRFDTLHTFRNGQAVVYDAGGGTSIGGLTSGSTYFVTVVDAHTITLSTSSANRAASIVDLDASVATGKAHALLEPANVRGSISSTGKTTVAARNDGLVVTATLAAANTDDEPDPSLSASNATESLGGQEYGVAASGSVSVNLITDTAGGAPTDVEG
jgi:hypothetical protein